MKNIEELARTFRLPETTTSETLACSWRHTLNFGNKVLLAGYFFRNRENSYFAAIYTHTDDDLSCESEIRLTAVSEDFFPDEGHSIQWAITQATKIKG